MIMIKYFILPFSLYFFVANLHRFLLGLPFSFDLKDCSFTLVFTVQLNL